MKNKKLKLHTDRLNFLVIDDTHEEVSTTALLKEVSSMVCDALRGIVPESSIEITVTVGRKE